ncbi:hypothetical protein GW17_00034501 [Ensete ventricosum]|nr:hypothetical protein GW17_00034501 [Ensete ventricosum]
MGHSYSREGAAHRFTVRYRVVPPGNDCFVPITMRNRPVTVNFNRRRPISSDLSQGREKEEEERSQPRERERRRGRRREPGFIPTSRDPSPGAISSPHAGRRNVSPQRRWNEKEQRNGSSSRKDKLVTKKAEVEAKEPIGKSESGIVNEGLGDCHE